MKHHLHSRKWYLSSTILGILLIPYFLSGIPPLSSDPLSLLTLEMIQTNRSLTAASFNQWLGVTSLVHIPSALAAIKDEREEVITERDAFAKFARRLTTIEPRSEPPLSQTRPMVGVGYHSKESLDANRVEEIRQAYQETVLAVSHHVEASNDSPIEDIALEFGKELAVALETSRELSPQLRDALLQATYEARNRRSRFIPVLEDEEKQLREAKRTLTTLEEEVTKIRKSPQHQFDELHAAYQHLQKCEQRCVQLLEERQEDHHQESLKWRTSEIDDLQTYLYQDLPVSYPILADAMTFLEQLRLEQNRIAGALARTRS